MNSEFYVIPLEPITTFSVGEEYIDVLDTPHFHIKRLNEEPQDPINDKFSLQAAIIHADSNADALPIPLRPLRVVYHSEKSPQYSIFDLWARAGSDLEAVPKNRLYSWDALRPSHPSYSQPTSSAFLSEQPTDTFDVIRNRAQKFADDSATHILSAGQALAQFNTILLGTSSDLYVWQPHIEKFQYDKTDVSELLIEGLSHVMSASVLDRIVSMGSLLRRLDVFVSASQCQSHYPAMHAFLHGLSVVLGHVKSDISRALSVSTSILNLLRTLSGVEHVLNSLASLCRMGLESTPTYAPLPTTDVALLSHVYNSLSWAITHDAPHFARAMLAFLLEASSSQFVAYLGNALGLLRPSLANLLKQQGTAAGTSGKDVEAGDPDDDFVLSMPPFVPAATAECLSRAKRSLKFLKSARPEHPLCSARKDWARLCCGWVWCTEDIERLADGVDRHLEEVEDLLCAWRRPPPDHRDALGTIPLSPTSDDVVAPLILFDVEAPSQKFAGHVYAPELAGFHLFDLELSEPATLVSDSTRPYDDFLSKFPNDLPLITPTLALLTQATLLYPLASHARLLSSSLLDLFFTDLRLLDHLRVLHSFMFLGATGFAARLREAFFSASDHEGAGSREAKQAARHKRVAPGMRLNLNERDKSLWPPSSSELSFLLRTVVEDSLVDTGAWGREQDKGGAEVWKEAVWRIGFVLETPEELGNESAKWRDPRAIEALDFLQITYRPPETLAVVVTSDIVWKYQRVFSFLLQVMRVESALRGLFHGVIKPTRQLFPNDPRARSDAARLRLHAQAFVSSLIGYLCDSAIGGNWDPFMTRLAKLERASHSGSRNDNEPHDVFSVLALHSDVLDSILEACLLKARHRSAGNSLRSCLQTILLFCRLIQHLENDKIDETVAVKTLEELYTKFTASVLSVLKLVRSLVEKSAQVSRLLRRSDMHDAGGADSAQDGMSVFEDLLLRIDAAQWYRKHGKSSITTAVH